MSLAGMVILSQAAPVPEADPKAFFLPVGAVALPAITGSALVDGLLLGKVAFLKAAILGGLLLSQTGGDGEAVAETYGAPPVDSYGAPAVAYEEPAPAYGPPQTYEEPAPQYDAPAPAYNAPAPSYVEPAPAYHEPAPAYETAYEPAPSYEAVDTYGPPAAPVETYGAPAAPAYGAPSY